VVIQKQQAKEKLHKLVAPLLTMHNAHQLSLQALGAIQPKLNLSFSEVGATLRDGTIILQGVTGHFNNAKVPMHMSAASVYHHTFQLSCLCVLASGGDCNAYGAQAAALRMTALHVMLLLWQKASYVLHIAMHIVNGPSLCVTSRHHPA